MELSFKEGSPIALLTKSDGDKKYIYIREQKDEKDDVNDIYEEIFNEYDIDESYIAKLKRHLLLDVKPKDKDLSDIWTKIKKIAQRKQKREIKDIISKEIIVDKDDFLFPIPAVEMDGDNNLQTKRIYITGPSGCGKTYWVAQYIKQWKKIHKKGKVYLFSHINEDKVLDELEPKRITLDDSFLDKIKDGKYKDLKYFKNSLVIFDDVDSKRNKDIYKAIMALCDQIFQEGRHYQIDAIRTNHRMRNAKETEEVLENASTIVFFPNGVKSKLDSFLYDYIGFLSEDRKKILNNNSRWTLVHKEKPLYVMTEHQLYLF